MGVATTENRPRIPTAPMTHNNQPLGPGGREMAKRTSGPADEMQKVRRGIERNKETQQSTCQGTSNNTHIREERGVAGEGGGEGGEGRK